VKSIDFISRPIKKSSKFLGRALKLSLSGDIHGLEREITKSALDYGIPGNAIGGAIRARRIASAPIHFMRQRAAAKTISDTSPYANFIDANNGYRIFSTHDLPGIINAVEIGSRFFNDKKNEHRGQGTKPFFSNICEEADLEHYPDLLSFPRSKPVFDMSASYLRAMPKLSAFGIFYSPPTTCLKRARCGISTTKTFGRLSASSIFTMWVRPMGRSRSYLHKKAIKFGAKLGMAGEGGD